MHINSLEWTSVLYVLFRLFLHLGLNWMNTLENIRLLCNYTILFNWITNMNVERASIRAAMNSHERRNNNIHMFSVCYEDQQCTLGGALVKTPHEINYTVIKSERAYTQRENFRATLWKCLLMKKNDDDVFIPPGYLHTYYFPSQVFGSFFRCISNENERTSDAHLSAVITETIVVFEFLHFPNTIRMYSMQSHFKCSPFFICIFIGWFYFLVHWLLFVWWCLFLLIFLLLQFQCRLQEDPPTGVSGAPTDNNIMIWNAVIFGPHDTPFEDGTFKLTIEFTEEYPNKPPTVRFVSKMFHPNVYADGGICLDILQNRWSPTYDVSAILTSIQVTYHSSNDDSSTLFEMSC